ncbi:MAG: hypothetical protein JWP97_1947 [Labilithrix sp.]|nr:hypothetical protein [Labilithrix sp.]
MKLSSVLFVSSTLLVACGSPDAPDAPADTTAASISDGLATATATAAEDSFTTKYDDEPRGALTNVRVGAGSLDQQAYLKFDVRGIPADAVDVKAVLKLHARSSSSDVVEAHSARSNAWTEATLNRANAPGVDAAILDKVNGTAAGAVASFDVSSAVDGNGTVSFVLSVASGSTVDFASKEAGAATAPALSITFKRRHTLFGAAFLPHNDAREAALAAQWGGMQVVRSYDYGGGALPFLEKYQAQDVRWGAASSYSFKYMPGSVVDGSHDAEIRGFFTGLAADHPVYWTYWHEPDDELYVKHTFTPAAYRAAWAHIKHIADQVKATRPHMRAFATLIVMEYSLSERGSATRPLLGPDGMYPGDDVIDVFGVDGYNSGARKGLVNDAAKQFAPAIDFAQAHHKPWAIGEIGSLDVPGNPQGRATYLREAIRYWNTRQAPVFAAYFDLDYQGNDYTFDDDAAATAVWRTALRGGDPSP